MSRPRQRSCADHARYRAGCDPCNVRAMRYAKRRRLVVLGGQVLSEPAEPLRQMVRELRAAGYALPDLARETGLNRQLFYRLSAHEGQWVQLRTAALIRDAYIRLRPFPGPDPRAAVWAKKAGWTPPAVEVLPPVIDRVCIDRALAGERVPMSSEERAEACREGARRGLRAYQIADVLHMNGSKVNRYLAGEQPKKRGGKKKAA